MRGSSEEARELRALCRVLPTILLIALWGMLGLPTSRAEEEAAKPVETVARNLSDDVAVKRKRVAEQIAELTAPAEEGAAEADQADVSATEDEVEFLETLDAIYAQQQARLEQRQELLAAKKEAEDDLASLRKFGPTESKPYSFLLLERLRDELAAEEDQEEAFETELKAARQSLEAAQDHFEEAEVDRRRAQEEFDEADEEDEEERDELATALRRAKRESEIAGELILPRKLEVEVRNLRVEVSTLMKTLLEEKVEVIGRDVRFTKRDLQERLRELSVFENELIAKLKDARSKFQQAEAEKVTALNELRSAQASAEILDLATEAWRVARDAQQTEMSLLTGRIDDIKRFRHYWTCRFETENGTAEPDQIQSWYDSLGDLVDDIDDNQRSLLQRIKATRSEQAKLIPLIRNAEDPAVERWYQFQFDQWQHLRDVCDTNFVQLKADERWCGRFYDELEARLESAAGTPWWTAALERWWAIWTFELGAVDDRPITVGKLVYLVLFTIAGGLAARIVSRLLGRRILPRLGMNEGASHAIQSISFYSLVMLFAVLGLQMVHIPLTAFAFLGGAVAIAIGFGSQEIANNFMSGIIILAEQPIRVGDIVVIDGVQGTIEHIGPRSTRIRTNSNHELIVPNSKLLSERVTNLTLSDKLVTTAVAVSVPLKMTVRQAKQLLLQAAQTNPMVLREPRPTVLLKQFGAASMDFELHFWLQLSDDMRAAIVQSDVRESINELFLQYHAQPVIAAAQVFANPPTATRPGNAA